MYDAQIFGIVYWGCVGRREGLVVLLLSVVYGLLSVFLMSCMVQDEFPKGSINVYLSISNPNNVNLALHLPVP